MSHHDPGSAGDTAPSPWISLDNNATTPLDSRVAEAMHECQLAGYANPASSHGLGRRARQKLDDARDQLASLLGANLQTAAADQLILTSGGTEANNLALLGLAGDAPGRVVVSAIEHPSVISSAAELRRRGFDVVTWPVRSNGVIDLEALDDLVNPQTRLVSVMLGNNETGVLQPVGQVARRCRAAGIPMHTDAVQAVGKHAVDFTDLGVTSLSFAPHKFHGPAGVGGLLVNADAPLKPILHGGFQQLGTRPGTEPVSLAVGAAKALELANADLHVRIERMERLRNELEQRLAAGAPHLVIHGAAAERLPHTSSVAFPGLDRQALVMALDLEHLACSTGSACASGSSEPSAVLVAMGLDSSLIESSIRLSLSALTTRAEIGESARRILFVVNELRDRIPAAKSTVAPRQWLRKPL